MARRQSSDEAKEASRRSSRVAGFSTLALSLASKRSLAMRNRPSRAAMSLEPPGDESLEPGPEKKRIAVDDQVQAEKGVDDTRPEKKQEDERLVLGRTAADPDLSPGFDPALDLCAGADEQQPVGRDIALVLPDHGRPGRELRPELGLPVPDHVEPVEEDAVAAPRAVGLAAPALDIAFNVVRPDEARLPGLCPFPDLRERDVTRDLDVVKGERAIAAGPGGSQVADCLRVEMGDGGAEDIG